VYQVRAKTLDNNGMQKISELLFPHWRSEQEAHGSWQMWLNRLLFDLDTPLGRNANLLGMLVIIGSVLLSMFATLPGLDKETLITIHRIEMAVSVAFAIEYFLRLYSSRWPLRYAFSFYGIVDLVTWLPLLLLEEAFLALRLLRILRLLKLLRYMRALRLFFASMIEVVDVVLVVLATIVVIALVSGNLIHYIEPQTFPDAYTGTWWSIVTMTTVGYGDLVPQSIAGKVAATVLMLAGVTSFALLTGTVSITLNEHLKKRSRCPSCHHAIAKNANFCPNCGTDQREPPNEQY
jgi:voltage-gated potassium channel